MKIIEIIGPPCSGKTYFKNALETKLKNDKFQVSTYSNVFFKFVFNERNLSLLDLITLLYFKYFKLKKELNIIKKNKKKKNLNPSSTKSTLLPHHLLKLQLFFCFYSKYLSKQKIQ